MRAVNEPRHGTDGWARTNSHSYTNQALSTKKREKYKGKQRIVTKGLCKIYRSHGCEEKGWLVASDHYRIEKFRCFTSELEISPNIWPVVGMCSLKNVSRDALRFSSKRAPAAARPLNPFNFVSEAVRQGFTVNPARRGLECCDSIAEN